MEIRNKPTEIKTALLYYLLLSYVKPESINQLPLLREQLGIHVDQILQDVCQRIVSFQQARRYPDEQLLEELKTRARKADSSVQAARDFQQMMDTLASLPERSKPKNRLHSKRGCQICAAPCRYGYFSLLIEPDLARLEELLKKEAEKPAGWRNAVSPVWLFTLEQIYNCLPVKHDWQINPQHMGNLAYCLITLATSKSRFPYPAAEMSRFQNMNQKEILSQEQL